MIGNEFRFHTYPSSEYVLGNASDINQDAEKRLYLYGVLDLLTDAVLN